MTSREVRQLEDFPLVEIVEYGSPEQTFAPAIDQDGSIIFDPDEAVLWRAKPIISGLMAVDGSKFRKVWEPGFVDVFITDRRIMCHQLNYDHGRNNTQGIANIALSSYSKWQAAKRRKGQVAAGQLRYENLHRLCLKSSQAGLLQKQGTPTLCFDAAGSGRGIVRLQVSLGKADPGFEEFVVQAASRVAGHAISVIRE